ncbi:MAG: FecR family protein [Muribaculaceae bacterium]|nr:FecR family protein [Muribaculaceae bacterium]
MNDLLDKLINDRLTSAELSELREGFNAASDEELAALLFDRDSENECHVSVPGEIIDETKSRIDSRLFGNPAPRRHNPFKKILFIAASILMPFLLAGTIWWHFDNASSEDIDICTVITARNESSSLRLPDGTSVKINGNSTLSFPSRFRKKTREVSFSGEAYFEVGKDTDCPFIIITPSVTVTVKGTAFNLLSRKGARYSEIALDNGSVSVCPKDSRETIEMTSGTKVIIDNTTGKHFVRPLDSLQNTSSWTSMELYFENATPIYLIDRIEQTYGTSLDSEMKKNIDENFTGTLPSDNLDETLRILNRIYSK